MKLSLKFVGLLVLLSGVFALQLWIGMDFSRWQNSDSPISLLLWQFRLPAAIAATLGGGLLSVAGLQMQTFFRNALAGPYVTGVSSGASLGVALLVFVSGIFSWQLSSVWLTFFFAVLGALFVCSLVFFIASKLRSNASLLLVGLMIAGLSGAVVELLQLVMSNVGLRSYYLWTQGSFYTVGYEQLAVLSGVFVFIVILSLALSGSLDKLLLGDEVAQLSGLNLKQTRALAIISAAVSAGVVTAFCGPIGFVGLAVPHIARMLFKTNLHLPLTAACFLLGGVVCGLCNALALSNVFGLMIPVNILTAMLGSPFVIWLIYKQNSAT